MGSSMFSFSLWSVTVEVVGMVFTTGRQKDSWLWVSWGLLRDVSWQPQVGTQVNYITPSDALTWSVHFAAQLLGLFG